jgi:hypothetical protein
MGSGADHDATSPNKGLAMTPVSLDGRGLAGPLRGRDLYRERSRSGSGCASRARQLHATIRWVQFSDALSGGSPIYPIGTTSGLDVNLATDSAAGSLNGWGWQNTAYWLSQPTTVTFATSGSHTMRIQLREDGVQLDQIVLSGAQYLSAAPGGVTNDSTIVPKP